MKHADLKKLITEHWNEITENQQMVPFPIGALSVFRAQQKNEAVRQLERLLIENNLLIERAERPSERAMRLASKSFRKMRTAKEAR